MTQTQKAEQKKQSFLFFMKPRSCGANGAHRTDEQKCLFFELHRRSGHTDLAATVNWVNDEYSAAYNGRPLKLRTVQEWHAKYNTRPEPEPGQEKQTPGPKKRKLPLGSSKNGKIAAFRLPSS
jgi:hypothetical protein